MSQKSTVTEYSLHASSMSHLEDVLDYIDILHSATADGTIPTYVGELSTEELMSVLRDIIYTAQETISEIETTRARQWQERKHQKPVLHIVPKVDKAG
ncbi:MAG: hypothetical protein Phog2KO_42090 [Phototrophicaceae bacterium]